MRRLWARAGLMGIVGLLFSVASCNQIGGIREGVPREDAECSTIEDCTVEVPECRTATACEQSHCVFKDALEGTPLAEQTPGDCVDMVCNGTGAAKLVTRETDVPDDSNPCSLDACEGAAPTYAFLLELPCYAGPAGTKNVGICAEGVQYCNEQREPIGGCEGEVLPQVETCASPFDDDCDGKVNEEGSACICGDGFVQPSLGETCDDSGTSDGDPCSPTCKEQKVLRVVGGGYHTCALLNDGSVKCWGRNSNGQLGLGDTISRGDGPNEMGDALLAVNLGPGKTASAMVAGGVHTCALLNDGRVKCWGYNGYGQLGLGDTISRGDGPNEMGDNLPAVNLGPGKTASAMVAGSSHTCALLNDGSVKCWGRNTYGQLGLGDTINRGDGPNEMGDTLLSVNLGPGKTAFAMVAGGVHTCALLNDGSVKCWGYNGYGQLGLGDTINRGDGPNEMGDTLLSVNLGPGKTAFAMVAGGVHTCALLNDGSVKCWGYNGYGQLGLDDASDRGDGPNEMGNALLSVNLGPGKTASAMVAGSVHMCALLNDGSVKCWGYNGNGQLGLGDTLKRGDGPNEMGGNLLAVNLGPGKTASAIVAGDSHACALLSDGSVKCWGDNGNGQLGLGDTNDRGDQPNEMGDNLPTTKLFSAFW